MHTCHFSYHLECNDGYSGINCVHQCYWSYGACIKATGICPTKGCQRGWKSDTCSEGELQMSILFKIISSVEMTITFIYTQRKKLSNSWNNEL